MQRAKASDAAASILLSAEVISVDEVALGASYQSGAAFSQAFKRRARCLPLTFRRSTNVQMRLG